MAFTLTFSTNNDVFWLNSDDQNPHEVVRILAEISEAVEFGHTTGTVRDINGTRVGFWAWTK